MVSASQVPVGQRFQPVDPGHQRLQAHADQIGGSAWWGGSSVAARGRLRAMTSPARPTTTDSAGTGFTTTAFAPIRRRRRS